jgi:hypothetical protein
MVMVMVMVLAAHFALESRAQQADRRSGGAALQDAAARRRLRGDGGEAVSWKLLQW